MKGKMFENIINHKFQLPRNGESEFVEDLFEDYFPKMNILESHRIILDCISRLYTENNKQKVNYTHIHLPYQTKKGELNLALFIINVLRIKEIEENLMQLKSETSASLYFINNKLENARSLNEYLNSADNHTYENSSISNIQFKHDNLNRRIQKKEFYDKNNLTGKQLSKFRSKQEVQKYIELNNYRFLAQILNNFQNQLIGKHEIKLSPSVYFLCLKGLVERLEAHSSNIWSSYSIEDAIQNSSKYNLKQLRSCVLNSNVALNEIEEDESYYNILNESIFFTHTKSVVLFNTLSKRVFDDYNYSNVSKLAKDYNPNLKRLISITFERKKIFSFIDYHKIINQVTTRYQIANDNSVIVFPFDFKKSRLKSLYFDKIEVRDLIDVFYEILIEIDEKLYSKYLSIWFFNLMSNILNTRIKDFIWEDLTNQIPEDYNTESLKAIFEKIATKLIIRNKSIINSFQNRNKLTLVLPRFLTNRENLVSSIKRSYRFAKIADWKSFKTNYSKDNYYLVLDYRDSKYDHSLSNNILDVLLDSKNVSFYFLSILFEKRFLINSKSYIEKFILLMLENYNRSKYFKIDKNKINEVIQTINSLIKDTEAIDDHFDDVDDSNYDQRVNESVKIFFGKRHATVSKSEKYLIQIGEPNIFKLCRADNLDDYNKVKAQKLSELYEDFNLFEESDKDRSEIEKFKVEHNIEMAAGDWLWKELLKRKATQVGKETLYKEMEDLSKKNKFHLVSKQTFEKSYLNPSNPTLPREKKFTKSLIKFLGLGRPYYRTLIKYKARQVLKSRDSNKQMEVLIQSLIQYKLFPEYEKSRFRLWYSWIKESQIIDLEDIGIFENVEGDIKDLVQILVHNIDCELITNIETVNHD